MKLTRTCLMAAVAFFGLSAACSSDDGDAGSNAAGGGGGSGGAGSCTAPSCDGCSGCLSLCVCLGTSAAQCSATCGSSGGAGGGGNAGTGGSGTGGGGTGGAAATGGTGGSGNVGGGTGEPKIPPAPANCPNLATGNITVMGQQVQLWVGPAGKAGPIIFYWHGTGSNSGEAGLLGSAVQEIQSTGGVIASFTTSTATGANTGNNVWYTGDFQMADQILACGVKQGVVDPRRVYAAGCSAGGLQAGAMTYERSSYLAASMPNSGGTVFPYMLQDPSHAPAVITAHGGPQDMVVVSFSEMSARLDNGIKGLGGFVVDCNHGGGHCQSPAALREAQWTFAKAHPFGVSPEPYAGGLPASFPTYCQIL